METQRTAEGLLKSAYEIARDERIAANKDVLRQLGLLGNKAPGQPSATSKPKEQPEKKVKKRETEQVEPQRKYVYCREMGLSDCLDAPASRPPMQWTRFCPMILDVVESCHATRGRRRVSTYLSSTWRLLVSVFTSVSLLCWTKTWMHRRSKRLRHEDAEFATTDITAAETAAKPVRARIGMSPLLEKSPGVSKGQHCAHLVWPGRWRGPCGSRQSFKPGSSVVHNVCAAMAMDPAFNDPTLVQLPVWALFVTLDYSKYERLAAMHARDWDEETMGKLPQTATYEHTVMRVKTMAPKALSTRYVYRQ
jgi:hypothetical protein